MCADLIHRDIVYGEWHSSKDEVISLFIAGESLAAYEVCYASGVGTMSRAQAIAGVTSNVFCISTVIIGSGSTGRFMSYGVIQNVGWAWSGENKVLYLSAVTPGAITETESAYGLPIGFSLGTDKILFSPMRFFVASVKKFATAVAMMATTGSPGDLAYALNVQDQYWKWSETNSTWVPAF